MKDYFQSILYLLYGTEEETFQFSAEASFLAMQNWRITYIAYATNSIVALRKDWQYICSNCIIIETTFLEGSELAMDISLIYCGRKDEMKDEKKNEKEEVPKYYLKQLFSKMLIERFGKVPQDIKVWHCKDRFAVFETVVSEQFQIPGN